MNPDGTYNLVKLEQSQLIKNNQRKNFRLYHAYPDGKRAFYEHQRDQYLPVTIVSYIHSSAPPGFEVHGNYQFTYDSDETKALYEGRAMMMYRLAEDGEINLEEEM